MLTNNIKPIHQKNQYLPKSSQSNDLKAQPNHLTHSAIGPDHSHTNNWPFPLPNAHIPFLAFILIAKSIIPTVFRN